MDSYARRMKFRREMGGLLSLPSFATNLMVLDERDMDVVLEDIVAHCFLSQANKTLVATKRKADATDMIQAVVKSIGMDSNIEDECRESKLGHFMGPLRDIKNELLELLISDISDIFQVDVQGVVAVRNLYRDGCVLIRKLSVITSDSGIFRIFPLLFIGALVCACTTAERIRLYHMQERYTQLVGIWLENILRVWLHSLDVAVIRYDGSIDDNKNKVSMEPWLVFILGARHVFQTAYQYLRFPSQDNTFNSTSRACNPSCITFDDVAHEDIINMYAVFGSICKKCECVIRTFYSSSASNHSFQFSQLWLTFHQLQRYLSTQTSEGTEGEELERMRDLIRSVNSLTRRCLGAGSDWRYHSFRNFELCFRANQFERDDIFSLHAHVLISMGTALLFQSDALLEIYETHVKMLVKTALED